MLVKHKHKSILPVIYSYKTQTQLIFIHPLYEGNLKEVLENPISLSIKVSLFHGVLLIIVSNVFILCVYIEEYIY